MKEEKERKGKGKGVCNGKEKDCVKLWGERREREREENRGEEEREIMQVK
jgi:hypothetical protein